MATVVYLGMATDIMAPLLLVPEVTTLFVIDWLDEAFSPDGTFEGQKREIKNTLTDGNDERTRGRMIYLEAEEEEREEMDDIEAYLRENGFWIHYLPEKAQILSEQDNGQCWRLQFSLNRILRELVFYHERNFFDEWPSEIVNVDHVMTMGASTDNDLGEFPAMLAKMITERTKDHFVYHALWHLHSHAPQKRTILRGDRRCGDAIASFPVTNKSSKDWFKQLYPRGNE